jgi:hypothetical protein
MWEVGKLSLSISVFFDGASTKLVKKRKRRLPNKEDVLSKHDVYNLFVNLTYCFFYSVTKLLIVLEPVRPLRNTLPQVWSGLNQIVPCEVRPASASDPRVRIECLVKPAYLIEEKRNSIFFRSASFLFLSGLNFASAALCICHNTIRLNLLLG